MKKDPKFENYTNLLRYFSQRICSDFYPNCSYCSCYNTCFPKDRAHDEMSAALITDNY